MGSCLAFCILKQKAGKGVASLKFRHLLSPASGKCAVVEDQCVFSPCNFSSQWLEIWQPFICSVKFSHIPKVLHREAALFAEFGTQIGRQPFDNSFAPAFCFLTFLDQLANVPVEGDQFFVDRTQCRILCRVYAVLEAGVIEAGVRPYV